MGVRRGTRRRRRFVTLHRPDVPTLFVVFVTPTFTNLNVVFTLFLPFVVACTVLDRVLMRMFVFTVGPDTVTFTRTPRTPVLLLLPVPISPILKEMTVRLWSLAYPPESILPRVLVTLNARFVRLAQLTCRVETPVNVGRRVASSLDPSRLLTRECLQSLDVPFVIPAQKRTGLMTPQSHLLK